MKPSFFGAHVFEEIMYEEVSGDGTEHYSDNMIFSIAAVKRNLLDKMRYPLLRDTLLVATLRVLTSME